MSRTRGLAIVVAALLAVGLAAGRAAPPSGASPTAAAGCTPVGSIVTSVRPERATLAGAATTSCTCTPSCSRIANDQRLFAGETITTRASAQVTFRSIVDEFPSFTCIVRNGGSNVIYPKAPVVGKGAPSEQTVLKLLAGGVTCQATDGTWQPRKKLSAVFQAGTTKLVIKGDPVFGIVAATRGSSRGSLVQVRKGSVRVGAAGGSSTTVGRNKQVFVANGSAAPGAVSAYTQADPSIRPALCALTPNLREQNPISFTGGSPAGHPLGLAEDASGDIWFTDDGVNAIGQYDLATHTIEYHRDGLNPGSDVKWIASDGHGDVWFTDVGATKAIGRVDTATGAITEYALPSSRYPWAIAYDPVDRRLWFTDWSANRADPAIGALDPNAIDPATKQPRVTFYRGLNGGSHPEGIAVGADGDVWFTDDNDPKPAIGTVSVKTHAVHEYPTGIAGSLPRGITAGLPPDRNLYFADERTVLTNGRSRDGNPGDGLVGVVAPTAGAPEIREFEILENGGNRGSVPEGLAADGNGHVWFTDNGRVKTIGMIDSVTGAVNEASDSAVKLTGKSAPIGVLLVARGPAKGLWFTDQFPNPRIGTMTASPSC